MTSNDFIDQLEGQLRAASQRRFRLELARVPRVPGGVGVLVVAAVIAVAVAVPVLAAHSDTAATHPAAHNSGGGSVVVGCGHTVSGRLPADWRSARAGTVVTGPISWVFLSQDAPHAVITHTQLIEALAVVDPGHAVTVSLPSSARRQVSLDYTDVSPRSRFSLSQGASSVTFRPCSGPVGHTQFLGGFIVSRPQCLALTVQVAGSGSGALYFFPLGRSCGGGARRVLKGDGIGPASFGERPKSVTHKLDRFLGLKPTRRSIGKGLCGIDGEIDWAGLETYYHHRRFVGYSYGQTRDHGIQPDLATARGLEVGDTIAQGRGLYGSAFHLSYAQGGSYTIHTKVGLIAGFLSDILHPRSKVLTIEAGDVGCPALSP